MKISKYECDKDFAERKLELSDEKCKQCEYLYLCPFMSMAMDEADTYKRKEPGIYGWSLVEGA